LNLGDSGVSRDAIVDVVGAEVDENCNVGASGNIRKPVGRVKVNLAGGVTGIPGVAEWATINIFHWANERRPGCFGLEFAGVVAGGNGVA